MMKTVITISLGALFGYVLIASEVFHWYRIQEMFHFQSFHMYGVLGSAIVTAALSVWLIKKFRIRSIDGEEIQPVPKPKQPFGSVIGGIFFGIGWGLTGACTAPVLILAGLKWEVGVLLAVGVLLGTILFAGVRKKLPK